MSFTEKWFAVRSDVADGGGTGTAADPFVASTPETFANRMRVDVPTNTLVRLGPGIFRTRGVPSSGFDPNINISNKVWYPKSGQRILGAGMFSTTLQLVWDWDPPTGNLSYNSGQRCYMVVTPPGSNGGYLRSFEISDLTLDCNLQNVPLPSAPTTESGTVTASTSTQSGQSIATSSAPFFNPGMVGATISFANGLEACVVEVSSSTSARINRVLPIINQRFKVFALSLSVAAVSLLGENIRLRRVRVINFGTRTPILFDGESKPDRSFESFPVRIEGRTVNWPGGDIPAFNSMMEECVLEQPFSGSGREVTQVVGSGVAPTADSALDGKLHVEPFGLGIRNCYMNFEFVNPRPGNPLPIESVVYSGSNPATVRVTTRFPHRLYAGDYIEIAGGGVPALNSRRFKVESISGTPKWAEREFTFQIELQPPQPSGAMSVFTAPLQTMPVASLSRNGIVVTAATTQKHGRKAGDLVVITGADQPEYNGTYIVSPNGLSDLQFRYALEPGEAPSSPATGDIWIDRRPNKFVRIDTLEYIGQGDSFQAEIRTLGAHFRTAGDWIMISGATGPGPNPRVNSYNNYVEVISVINKFTFRVRLPGARNVGAGRISQGADAGFGGRYTATYANGGFGGGVTGNRIAFSNVGCYHDFYWHRHLIVRKNYFYDVNIGVCFAVEAVGCTYASSDPTPIWYRGFREARIQSINGNSMMLLWDRPTADPGFVPGVLVRVIHRNSPSTIADGYVTAVGWEANKYKVTVRTPGAAAFGAIAGDQVNCDLWFQQSLFLVEDNILEVSLSPRGYITTAPIGISALGPYWATPPLPAATEFTLNPVHGLEDGWNTHLAVIRENLIRKVRDGVDPLPVNGQQNLSFGIRMNSCENLIVEGNLIGALNNPPLGRALRAHELGFSNSRTIKVFNNRYPNGELCAAFNDPSWHGNTRHFISEIESQISGLLSVGNSKEWI